MNATFILTENNTYSLINNSSDASFLANVPGQINSGRVVREISHYEGRAEPPHLSLTPAFNECSFEVQKKKQSMSSTSDKDWDSPRKKREREYSQVFFEIDEKRILGDFKGYEYEPKLSIENQKDGYKTESEGKGQETIGEMPESVFSKYKSKPLFQFQNKKKGMLSKIKHFNGVHVLKIVLLAKRFIRKMKLFFAYQRLKEIPKANLELIGDKVWYQNGISIKIPKKITFKNNNVILSLKEQKTLRENIKDGWKALKKFLFWLDKKIPVFMRENNYFTLIFDLVSFYCLIFNIFFIPLDESFSLLSTENTADKIYLMIIFSLAILFLEIIIFLNTAFFHKGTYIFDRRIILKNYIKNYFVLDLITIPPYIMGLWFQNQLFSLLFVLRFYKVKTYYSNFKEFFLFGDKMLGLVDFSYLLLQVLFITHFSACLWHMLGMGFQNNGVRENWLFERGLVDATWGSRYVNAFYWSITTMLTVGYGDIVPINGSEKTFTIVVIVFSSWLFGYSLNRVGEIFKNMFKKENEYKFIMEGVNKFLKIRKINKNLQSRIQRYIEYVIFQEETGKRQLDLLNEKLSNKLKEELTLEIYKSVVKKFSLLYKNFSPEFLKKIALKIKEVDLAPDDILLEEAKVKEPSLYFVMNGELEIFANVNGRKVSISFVKKNSSFGEEFFFGNSIPKFSACSVNISKVCVVSLSDFMSVLNEYPKDYETFCKLKDDFLNNLNQEPIYLKCHFCQSKSHQYHKCPQIRYIVDKKETVKKKKAEETQTSRMPTQRKRHGKTKSTKLLYYIANSVERFQTRNASHLRDFQEYVALGGSLLKMKDALDEDCDSLNGIELATLSREEMVELHSKIANNFDIDPSMEEENSLDFSDGIIEDLEESDTVFTSAVNKIKTMDRRRKSTFLPKKQKTSTDLNLLKESPKNIQQKWRNVGESPKNSPKNVPYQEREKEKEKKISNAEKTTFTSEKSQFDIQREYKIYFPHNNLTEILKNGLDKSPPKTATRRSLYRASQFVVRTNIKSPRKKKK